MDGRRIELSTSILVDVDNWNKSRQEIAGNSQEVRILNNRLLKFVSGIYDIYNQLEAGRDDFDIYTIKEKITVTSSKVDRQFSYSKIKYQLEQNKLQEYIRLHQNPSHDFAFHKLIKEGLYQATKDEKNNMKNNLLN